MVHARDRVTTTPVRRLLPALADDLRAGARASAGGAIAVAAVEWIATIVRHTGPVAAEVAARLLLVDAALVALMWVVLLPVCALAAAVPRLLHAVRAGRAAAAAAPRAVRAPSRWPAIAAPAIVTGAIAAIGFAAATTFVSMRLFVHYKEPVLVGLVGALAALVAGVAAFALARAAAGGLTRAAAALRARGPAAVAWSPLGSPWLALAVAVVLVVIALRVTGRVHPHLRPVWPWAKLLTLLAFVVGAGAQLELAARPARRRARSRTAALAGALAALVLVPLTLIVVGADTRAKYVAVTSSPTLARAITLVRAANDLDRDGFGSLLGENDCAPRNRKIRPGVRDLPDNGIDENCDGRDFSMRDLAVAAGPTTPVPPAFQKPWNVLFITVDTLRYDYTSFGGRLTGPRRRDTTPRMAELVSRAASFTFAQAPSAGTMASVPAIMTSKFFHSGIALDEKNIKPGMPPRLKPDNVTLAEIMKGGGYTTGAILTHEYFNDWGLQQGFDWYDNEIGKTHDPRRISADRVTDRALAWIADRPTQKWFLWLHYLDPHAHYVAHPGEKSFGESQEDLYEGEIHWTDKQIGRLLDELVRLPGGERTIVVITSDHGDAFGEHGFDGHAIALTREILNVPLIFYIPDNPPRQIGGAVSNLDAVPTVAQLCGIDVSKLSFEGKSLVPQIFFGQEEPDRVVFAETNYPSPLRAAVSARWKLVYNMKANFHELYDLVADPWEKHNVAHSRADGMAVMRDALDRWLERVVFSRDATMSQAATRMAKVLLAGPPAPQVPVQGVAFDGGAVEVIGADVPALAAGAKATVAVYLKVVRKPSKAFSFGVALWGVPAGAPATTPIGPEQARSGLRVTLDGLLPSDRWRPGEYVREEMTVTLPPQWTSPAAALGLIVGAPRGEAGWQAPQPAGDPSIGALAVVPVTPSAAPPPAPPAPPLQLPAK